MFATSQHAHFIGIAGIGMSGIAEILLNQNMRVSGSDLRRTPVTERLAQLGAIVYEGHEASHVAGATVVVTSSAVHADNPEVLEARARKIPVIQRAEMLAELMRLKYGIAIAGMHGKTTTTSMVAAVLAGGDLDPTVVVGGRVDAMGSNARLGKSQYLVAEADESDRSFLKLSPILAVVTNIDREHMDCYRNMRDVKRAFLDFMDHVPFYGMVVVCNDDPQLRRMLPQIQRRTVTYGTRRGSDFHIKSGEPVVNPGEYRPISRFHVTFKQKPLGEFRLHVNVDQIRTALENFRGVDRRFQLRGTTAGVSVIDDYGHHPTEVRATLAAARQCGFRKIHVIFQPHRYTRTQLLMDEFANAFDDADTLFVLDIYAASEPPIEGITGEVLAQRIEEVGKHEAHYAASFADAAEAVVAGAHEGEMILTLGAGSVSQLGPMILEKLQARQDMIAEAPKSLTTTSRE